MVVLGTVCVYVLVLFLPGYASRQFHLPQSDAFAVTAYMSLVGAIWCVIAGWISDRIGRKPLLLVVEHRPGDPDLSDVRVAGGGAEPRRASSSSRRCSRFWSPPSHRCRRPCWRSCSRRACATPRLALSYNIAVAIFGGFGQFIVAWLIIHTGDVLAPAYYVLAASVVGLIAVLPLADRTGQALE